MDAILIPVILSGGSGTRLWPVSRESHPKPFITLPDGQSLLQKTFVRACLFSSAPEIMTITNKDYYLKSKAEYESVLQTGAPKQSYLLEPFAANTAPAILLAALKVQAQYGDHATLLILPADHLITRLDEFTHTCQQAAELANKGFLVTFGIKPTQAETGYGYIECGAVITHADTHVAKRFVEKPDQATAEQYLADEHYLWNAGMFCFAAGEIIEQYRLHAPDLFAAGLHCWQETIKHNKNNDVMTLDEKTFAQLKSISIDYAIMEKSASIAVITSHFAWRDIGSWEAYHQLFAADNDGNTILGDAILIDAKNNFIHNQGRMVAAIGIENLAIIDTPDAVLITHRDRTQDVKQVVQALKLSAHESYATHRTVIRPWGSYTVLEEGAGFKIKRITVKARASLSLQKHNQRSEHWVVVEGTAEIIIGDQTFQLQTNESTFVPMNTLHRLSNPTDNPLVIIEVQTGEYLGEDDIIRMQDSYGRA